MPLPDTEALLKHARFVRAIAASLVRDVHSAEDITQDAMTAALVRRPRSSGLRPWLRRVARNLSLNALRSERRRRRREQKVARPEALPSTGEAVERLDTHRRVVGAVRELAEPYRSTVIYRFFYDLSVQSIADRLAVPRETVRTRLRRALEKLRTTLAEDRGEGSRDHLLALVPLARVIDAALQPAAAICALRAIIVLQRTIGDVTSRSSMTRSGCEGTAARLRCPRDPGHARTPT